MQIATRMGALAGALLLCACAQPVPAEKERFVGEWQAPQMYLLVQQDGHVRYLRQEGSTKTSVTGPLQGFQGDNFTVGVWFMATTFNVTQPPHEVEGTLRMTVDGVELIRVGDGAAPTPPDNKT
jgi:hypothetical protein